jgi:hypothetical protein
MKKYCTQHEFCNCTRACAKCGGSGYIASRIFPKIKYGKCYVCRGWGSVQFRDCRKNWRGKNRWVQVTIALVFMVAFICMILRLYLRSGMV